MTKRLSPILLAIALLLVILPFLRPEQIARAQSYPDAWRTYDRFDGVDANRINSAIYTEDGVLWFGTDRGVLRFDGEWQSFGENEGLPNDPVAVVVADAEGTLWATTVEGVARLVDGMWQVEDESLGLPKAPFQALAALEDGTLLAGGNAGLYVRDPASGRWSRDETNPVGTASHLALATDGAVWAAGSEGLARYEGEWTLIPLQEADAESPLTFSALAPGPDADMWIGTSEGLAHRSGGRTDWLNGPGDRPIENIWSILETADGDLWVGANSDRTYTHTENGWLVFTPADGSAANYVSAMVEDKDGALWMGTVAGVSRFDPQSWQRWNAIDDAPDTLVGTLAIDDDGDLWAGAAGKGVYQFEDGDWSPVELTLGDPPTSVLTIESSFVDQDGALWFGTNGNGAFRYADGEILHLTTADGLAGNTVEAIAQTSDGALWFGTHRDGLSRWDEQDWHTFTTEDGLGSNRVQSLLVDSEGQLWVGTDGGLSTLVDGEWSTLTADDGLAGNDITAMAEAADGSLWATTWGGGASRLKDGEWTTYSTADGLLGSGLTAIWAEPDSNRVWFGTVSGLSVFDDLTWQNYGVAQGRNLGQVYAVIGNDEGQIFIGTEQGVTQFTPDRTPPIVNVRTVNALDADGERVQVTPEQNIRVVFEGKDLLTEPGNLFYRYRLAGHDEDWQGTRKPEASYPPLAEGEYRFEVEARDDGLNYSVVDGVNISVRREPSTVFIPFVGTIRTTYALIDVAVLTLLGVLAIYAGWSTATRLAMRRQAVERRFNPYVAGSPIREAKMFYGRETLLDGIVSGLYQNSLMIHGERRIGKTSLLYQVKQRLLDSRSDKNQFVPIYVDLEGTPEPEFFHRLMEGVLEALSGTLDVSTLDEPLEYEQDRMDEVYTDREFRRDLRQIIERLQEQFHRQPRLVFLLDEADIMNTYDTLTQQQLRRILQDAFAQNVGAVVAGVNISKAWDRVESPWYNMFVEMAMEPFDWADAERLMRDPVARFYDWDDDALHYVFAQSQGRPHRIQQICMEAVNTMLDEQRRRITLQDVQRGYERVIFAESN